MTHLGALKVVLILIDVMASFGTLAYGVGVSLHLAPHSVFTENTEFYIFMFLACIGVLIASPFIWILARRRFST